MRKPAFLRHNGTSTSQQDAVYGESIEKKASPTFDPEKNGADINKLGSPDLYPAGTGTHGPIKADKLARKLSARQDRKSVV